MKNKMSIKQRASLLAAALMITGTAHSQELLVNPGFELSAAGDMPPQGWTFEGGDRVKDGDGTLDEISPRTGDLVWQIQFVRGSGASISQAITLEAGDYALSTFYAVRAGNNGATEFTFELLDASGTTVLPASATNPPLVGGEFVELTRSYQGLDAGDYTVTFAISGPNLRQGSLDDFSLMQSVALPIQRLPCPTQ